MRRHMSRASHLLLLPSSFLRSPLSHLHPLVRSLSLAAASAARADPDARAAPLHRDPRRPRISSPPPPSDTTQPTPSPRPPRSASVSFPARSRPDLPIPHPTSRRPTLTPRFVLPHGLTRAQRDLYLQHLHRIQHFLDRRCLPSALSAFAALTSSSLPPSAGAYELLLDAAGVASDAEAVVAVLIRAEEEGLQLSVKAWHRAVRVLLHTGCVDEAWRVFGLLRVRAESGGCLLPLLPVVPLLLERSQTTAGKQPYEGEVKALHGLLVSRRTQLSTLLAQPRAEQASSAPQLGSDLQREFVFVSLALLDSTVPASSSKSSTSSNGASVAEVTAIDRALKGLRPPLSDRQAGEVCRALISAYTRLSAFDEAREVCQRWVALIKTSPTPTPAQQQTFRLAIQDLLLLSRVLTGSQASDGVRASHMARVQGLLDLLLASRVPPDDRTLLVLLCSALPADDTRHQPLLSKLRRHVHLPAVPTASAGGEDVAAVRRHRQELAKWVMSALTKFGIHPSQDTASLLASSLDLSASSPAELEAAFAVIPALRSQYHVQPSYALLHSLLPVVSAKQGRRSSLPVIPPLLQHFAETYSLPPSSETLHLIHSTYQPRTAAERGTETDQPISHDSPAPSESSMRPLVHHQPLALLYNLSRSYGQPLSASTVLSLLRSAVAMGGTVAARVASRTRKEWESLQSLEAAQLAVRCWMQGGERGRETALRWWMTRARREERVDRDGESRRLPLLALDDGVMEAMVSGLRLAGDEEGAIDVAERWTKWRQWSGRREEAAQTTTEAAGRSTAQKVGNEAQLDEL